MEIGIIQFYVSSAFCLTGFLNLRKSLFSDFLSEMVVNACHSKVHIFQNKTFQEESRELAWTGTSEW